MHRGGIAGASAPPPFGLKNGMFCLKITKSKNIGQIPHSGKGRKFTRGGGSAGDADFFLGFFLQFNPSKNLFLIKFR